MSAQASGGSRFSNQDDCGRLWASTTGNVTQASELSWRNTGATDARRTLPAPRIKFTDPPHHRRVPPRRRQLDAGREVPVQVPRARRALPTALTDDTRAPDKSPRRPPAFL